MLLHHQRATVVTDGRSRGKPRTMPGNRGRLLRRISMAWL
jgi:hypothetical protein